MVNFGGEKMSKSLGNVVSIRKVAETHDLEALRLLLVSVHYRSPVDLHPGPRGERPGHASPTWTRPRRAWTTSTGRSSAWTPSWPRRRIGRAGPPPSELADRVDEAMDDDFNTAAVLGHLYDAFVLVNKLLDEPKAMPKPERLATLAALRPRPAPTSARSWASCSRPPSEFLLARRGRLCARRKIDPAEIEARIADRVAARAARATSPGPTRSGPSCASAASS